MKIVSYVFATALIAFGVSYAITNWSEAVQLRPRPVAPVSPIGTYACQGTSSAGDYTVTAEVIEHEGLFHVRWTFPAGDQMFAVGDFINGSLVMGYYGSTPGAVVYRVTATGLDGQWIMAGQPDVYPETCVRESSAPPNPAAQPVTPHAQPGITL